MTFWNRRTAPADHISPESLASFGRFEFLGAALSGIEPSEAYGMIVGLNKLIFTSDLGDRAQAIAELQRHAAKGEWQRVGAWKYVREFMSDGPGTRDLIDGGLMAIHRMRVTNLSICPSQMDTQRYTEVTGEPPPHDGFFGPPAFDSDFGPRRQYYLDRAVAAASTRTVLRLPSQPGVEPGPVEAAAKAMWDLGLLIYRGPLLVSSDIAFEPHVARPAVQAADGVDHRTFANRLARAVLDTQSSVFGLWSAIGGARFIEDYLDNTAAETTGYARLRDTGLRLLITTGEYGLGVAPGVLTPRQRDRLAELELQ
jgi:hypothetical protein